VLFLFQAYLASILEKQNVAGAQPIVAIEEPEAHLHPFATRSLWNTIDALTGQKLVASHSGDLVANAPLESIRRLYVLNGETRVGLVPVNLLDSNEARKIRFHISNPRGELLFARCWLLVEGETEFWLLDGLARTTGRELDRWGIRIVQYTNSGAECLLKVANALGIPWFLLADGDGAGKKYIRTAGDHLNGVPAADCIVGLAEDNIECHLCSVGFESIFLNHVSPQKKGQVTGTAGSAEYWKQITKAGDDTPKPEVMREVIEAIRNGASPPPALIYVLDRALELAGAISNLTEEVPQ
jgi:putative ATP-dependent endonuclease of OLD family